MALRKVTRDQFEHLGEGKVRHRPLGVTYSTTPNTDPIDVEIDREIDAETAIDKEGYEYNHNEVRREALDMLRNLASGALR